MTPLAISKEVYVQHLNTYTYHRLFFLSPILKEKKRWIGELD